MKAASAKTLADTLLRERDQAMLFRRLATLRTDVSLFDDVEQLRWKVRHLKFNSLAASLDAAVTKAKSLRR